MSKKSYYFYIGFLIYGLILFISLFIIITILPLISSLHTALNLYFNMKKKTTKKMKEKISIMFMNMTSLLPFRYLFSKLTITINKFSMNIYYLSNSKL